jgi:hypothetical protein
MSINNDDVATQFRGIEPPRTPSGAKEDRANARLSSVFMLGALGFLGGSIAFFRRPHILDFKLTHYPRFAPLSVSSLNRYN